MKPLHRTIAGLAIVALATGVIAYAIISSARSSRPSAPPENATGEPPPETTMQSAEMTYTEGGMVRWRAMIDEIQLQRGGEVVAHKLREGIIYDDTHKPALHVKADRIEGNTARKDFKASGEVVVTSPQGFVIRARKVDWINDDQKIHCSEAVRMKAKDLIITSATMDYLLRPNTVTCPSEVYMYSGDNQIEGTGLVYSVKDEDVQLRDIRMIINPEEARKIVREWENQ
jgi:lipopolysaccharide export system protein LptA